MSNLDLLLEKGKESPDVHVFATVTDDSPLAIQLDGDSAPLLLVPETTVTGLAIGNRVLVLLMSGGPSEFQGKRLVVVGKFP